MPLFHDAVLGEGLGAGLAGDVGHVFGVKSNIDDAKAHGGDVSQALEAARSRLDETDSFLKVRGRKFSGHSEGTGLLRSVTEGDAWRYRLLLDPSAVAAITVIAAGDRLRMKDDVMSKEYAERRTKAEKIFDAETVSDLMATVSVARAAVTKIAAATARAPEDSPGALRAARFAAQACSDLNRAIVRLVNYNS